jgi:hypothetical protein
MTEPVVPTPRKAYLSSMAQPVSEPQLHTSRSLMIVAGVVAVLLGLTGALWAHYGTAVFYEMIVAGIALCI